MSGVRQNKKASREYDCTRWVCVVVAPDIFISFLQVLFASAIIFIRSFVIEFKALPFLIATE